MGELHLEIADWRRHVAMMWQVWRSASPYDAGGATTAFRIDKDQLFKDHAQSPLLPADRAGFPGLAYWDYDPAWRMTVRFEPLDDAVGGGTPAATAPAGGTSPFGGGSLSGGGSPFGGFAPIALPNSGAETIDFVKIGRVELSGPLAGQSLSVFWIQGYAGGIFLPFRDATSGTQTYGAGRYLLDTIKSADHGSDAAAGTLLLDFNMAFHPSCAYDPKWACPLAPPENNLHVSVPIGERLRG